MLLFISVGCNKTESNTTVKDIKIGNMYDYSFDDSQINNYLGSPLNSVNQIFNWIYANIKYKLENLNADYWQLPHETYFNKNGDCEDLSILFMYLLEKKLNIYSELVAIKQESNIFHAIVYIPSQKIYIDPQGPLYNVDTVKNLDILWYAPYYEIIWMTYYYHGNVGIYY